MLLMVDFDYGSTPVYHTISINLTIAMLQRAYHIYHTSGPVMKHRYECCPVRCFL